MVDMSLNLNVRGIGQSATMAINARSKALGAEGREIVSCGLGQSPFPVPAHVVAALKAHAGEKDYLPVEGLPELRRAVAAWHRRVDGAPAEADGVLIGPGSKELMFLLQLTFYGDLLVPTPCWVSYGPQARIVGRRVVALPTSYEARWRLSAAELEAHCASDPGRPRVLILNYPGNPDGCSYEDAELRAIADVARRHQLIVLSDEIYGPLSHTGAHVSIATHYPDGTIVSGGLSKWCGAGGWRLGTFAFPPALYWLKSAMSSVASETYTSVSAPVQYAAVAAYLPHPEMDIYLSRARMILGALGARCRNALVSAGGRVHPPTGAFYMMADFEPLRDRLAKRGITGSADLTERALEETGVAFLPGVHFERPPNELSARLAYVDFDGRAALEGCAALPEGRMPDEAFLQRYCGRLVAGIDRLAAWLRD